MENENQARQNSNALAIKQNQGPFWALSFELFCRYWNPSRVKEAYYIQPTSTEIPDQ